MQFVKKRAYTGYDSKRGYCLFEKSGPSSALYPFGDRRSYESNQSLVSSFS